MESRFISGPKICIGIGGLYVRKGSTDFWASK